MDAILTAAAHVLARQGLVGLTTNSVAARAGVSIGSLYQYFPDKKALIAALLERERRCTLDALAAALERHKEAPVAAAVDAALDAVWRRAQEHAAIHDALFHQAATMAGDHDGGTRTRRDAEGLLAAFFAERGVELPVADVERAAFTIVSAVNALTHEAMVRGDQVAAGPGGQPAAPVECRRLVFGYLGLSRPGQR